MALPGARNQYLKTQIETASKEQLVVMLFDGIIRFTEQARKAIEAKQIEESHNALMRAQAIVMELICTVDKDKGGEVASNLMGLHAYSFNCLIQCNMHKDLTKIDEVQKIYRELREGWVGAMESLGLAGGAAKPGEPPAKPTTPPTAKAPIGKPAAPASLPKAAPTQSKPSVGPGSQGIMAAGSAAPAAAKPVAPAAVRPAPAPVSAVPKAAPVAAASRIASGYGMGKTATMGAGMAARPVAPVPAAPVQPQAATPAKPVAAPMNPKQAAMLNAYQAGTRSIA